MSLFKKKSTGVEISEYFMKVNESPTEAVTRASREYDLPETVYYDKARNILKAIGDQNSEVVQTAIKQEAQKTEESAETKESLISKEEKVDKKDDKSPELMGKTSKVGMGIPKLRAIDNVDLEENALKNKPFFKSARKSDSNKKRRVSDDELSQTGGEDE